MGRTMAVVMLCLAIPAVGWAQSGGKAPTLKREPAKNTSSSDGRGMFLSYCSPCHGKLGRGDGPAAAALKNPPADLTKLKKNHGGTYSQKDFEDRINGLAMGTSHGTSEMPVWGPIFRALSGPDQLRIFNLKAYIDALQAP